MHRLPQRTFTFNEFTLDLTRGCLFRDNDEIKLRPKSFETLRYLVENSGRLISKNELIEAVWPDTSVTDDSLVQCLIDVRRALGENGQQIVKTVPRRGYIFKAEVTPSELTQGQVIYTDEVEAVSVTVEEEDMEDEPPPRTFVESSSRRSWFRSHIALVVAALIATALT